MCPQKSQVNLADRIRQVLFSRNAREDRPMTEQELADRFGVSRSPIRDALKELEKEGVVERRKRKGLYLKAPSVSEILALYDVRSVLEGFAARLTAGRATPKDVKQLLSLARAYEQARRKTNPRQAEAADKAFHKRIVELSGNPWLIKIMGNFDIIHKAFHTGCSSDPSASAKNRRSPYRHEKLVKVLKTGDPEECERIFRAHIQWSKQSVVEEAFGVALDQFDNS